MLGGQLLTNGRTIEAKVYDSSANVVNRTVLAGESKVSDLFWDFGTPAYQVLGQEITWIWKVRIGKDEHILRVPMRRQEPGKS